jgi:hypothetical protein
MRNATLTVVALTIWLLAHATDDAYAQTRPFNIQKAVVALDEQPRFPGCDISGATDRERLQCSEEKLGKYIEENLKYPDVAKEPDFIPRVVWITVTIEYNGRIHSPKVVQAGIKAYDENAQNVFVQMARSDIRGAICVGRPESFTAKQRG